MSFTCAANGKHTEGKPVRVITEIRLQTYHRRELPYPQPNDEGGRGWEIAKEVDMSTAAAIAFCCSQPGQAIKKIIGRLPADVELPIAAADFRTARRAVQLDPFHPPTIKAPKI